MFSLLCKSTKRKKRVVLLLRKIIIFGLERKIQSKNIMINKLIYQKNGNINKNGSINHN